MKVQNSSRPNTLTFCRCPACQKKKAIAIKINECIQNLKANANFCLNAIAMCSNAQSKVPNANNANNLNNVNNYIRYTVLTLLAVWRA